MKWIYFTHHDNNYISTSLLDKCLICIYSALLKMRERKQMGKDNTDTTE